MEIVDWGLIPYSLAYEQQKELFNQALSDKEEKRPIQNKLILCEHPHVITVGKHGLFSNLLFPEDTLKEKQVELFHVDRGGDITYHGPGQLVAYPIFDLESFGIGLKEFIRRMEEAMIKTLAEYGIEAARMEGATGVWLDNGLPSARKIAAIGVRSSRFVTMHGLALNVNTDLDYFRLINPCGFIDKGVTSMAKELGREIDMGEVKSKLAGCFEELFYKY